MKNPKTKATVQDLIDELIKVPDKTLPVTLEGCDCYGPWRGTVRVVDDRNPYVLLERDQ